MLIPNVLEQTANGERSWDIVSRLLNDRIIFIGTEINDQVANIIVAQLIYLQSNDPRAPIHIYINSPGGEINSGLAIYDTIQFLECEVFTYCIGMAASMGALLLCAGTKGKRYALPHSRIMIHQPHGGATGRAEDIRIQAKEILYLKKQLANLLAKHTGKDIEQIHKDTERDYFLSAAEAIEYGIIDQILESKSEVKELAGV